MIKKRILEYQRYPVPRLVLQNFTDAPSGLLTVLDSVSAF